MLVDDSVLKSKIVFAQYRKTEKIERIEKNRKSVLCRFWP